MSTLHTPPTAPPPAARAGGGARALLFLLAMLAMFGYVAYRGIRPRKAAEAALAADTAADAAPVVAVAHPRRAAATDDIVLPANLQAFSDSPVYARASGYIRSWTEDIGAHVKAGQLLATIEIPEVDEQLQQARADLATAQANEQLAKLTNDRDQNLLKQDGVSQQDADNAAGDYAARQSAVRSAQANVARLTQSVAFSQVRAPFDGVITARNIDIGSLIDAGAGQRELFHIAATNRLRVYVNLPQDDTAAAKPGLRAKLLLPQYPGRSFTATLLTTADSMDPATRTLLAQFLVDNANGELLPGSYAELHMAAPAPIPTFLVPVGALLFRQEGPRVVVVANGKAQLRTITIGRDLGTEIEILTGLQANDWIVTNPPDSVENGESLRVVNGGTE